jgi:hypothetical protein
MGRFYKTAIPADTIDFMYQPPLALAMKAQEYNDQQIEEQYKQQQLMNEHLIQIKNLAQDDEIAKAEIEKWQKGIEALAGNLNKDPLNWRKQSPIMDTVSKQLEYDLTKGKLASIQAQYDTRMNFEKKMDEGVKLWMEDPKHEKGISPEQKTHMLNYFDQQYKQKGGFKWDDTKKTTLNTYQTEDPTAYMDINKVLSEAVKDYKPDEWEKTRDIETGKWIYRNKVSNESIEEEKLWLTGLQYAQSDPAFMAYLKQGSKVGYAPGYFYPDDYGKDETDPVKKAEMEKLAGTMINPVKVVETEVEDPNDPTKKVKVQSLELNYETPMAKALSAMSDRVGYTKTVDDVTIQRANDYGLAGYNSSLRKSEKQFEHDLKMQEQEAEAKAKAELEAQTAAGDTTGTGLSPNVLSPSGYSSSLMIGEKSVPLDKEELDKLEENLAVVNGILKKNPNNLNAKFLQARYITLKENLNVAVSEQMNPSERNLFNMYQKEVLNPGILKTFGKPTDTKNYNPKIWKPVNLAVGTVWDLTDLGEQLQDVAEKYEDIKKDVIKKEKESTYNQKVFNLGDDEVSTKMKTEIMAQIETPGDVVFINSKGKQTTLKLDAKKWGGGETKDLSLITPYLVPQTYSPQAGEQAYVYLKFDKSLVPDGTRIEDADGNDLKDGETFKVEVNRKNLNQKMMSILGPDATPAQKAIFYRTDPIFNKAEYFVHQALEENLGKEDLSAPKVAEIVPGEFEVYIKNLNEQGVTYAIYDMTTGQFTDEQTEVTTTDANGNMYKAKDKFSAKITELLYNGIEAHKAVAAKKNK